MAMELCACTGTEQQQREVRECVCVNGRACGVCAVGGGG